MKQDVHGFNALFCVSSADKVDQELAHDLLKCQNSEELRLYKQISRIAFSIPNSELDLLHKVWLLHVILR